MSRGDAARRVRPLGLAGVAWGVLLLARGDAVFRSVQARPPSSAERAALVALGFRHTGQGLLQLAVPRHLHRTWVGVDLLHAVSMLAVAWAAPSRRRAAVTSAALALLGAAAAGSAGA